MRDRTCKKKLTWRYETLPGIRWKGNGTEKDFTYVFIASPQEFFLRIKSESGYWRRRCIWRWTRQRYPRCLQQDKSSVSTEAMKWKQMGIDIVWASK
jgi:hypothetical protein